MAVFRNMWARNAQKLLNIPRLIALNNACGRRYILSEAYSCNVIWQKRLQSPVFQNLDINDFVLKLNEKFDKQGAASSIDMDILANKVQDVYLTQLDFVDKLFYRYRHTQEALYILPSTTYSLIRGYIELGETDRLVDLIQDKIGYGIFPDFYSANILIDHLIKSENYLDATRVAGEMALQEDLSHPITRLLVLYSCHMFLQHPVEEVEPEQPEPPAPPSDEITYMRVPFVRNPHFDDHFDLIEEDMVLGKTLNFVGRLQDDIIGRSSQVIGWLLYQKFDKALDLLRKYAETSEESTITESVFDIFKSSLEKAEVVEPEEANKPGCQKKVTSEMKEGFMKDFEDLSKKLMQSNKVTKDNLTDLVKDYVKSELPKYEPKDIEEQTVLIEKWAMEREEKLARQIKKYQDAQKKEELIQKLKELRKKEEFLNYFAMQEDIKLAESKVKRPKKVKQKHEIDDSVLALLKPREKKQKNLS